MKNPWEKMDPWKKEVPAPGSAIPYEPIGGTGSKLKPAKRFCGAAGLHEIQRSSIAGSGDQAGPPEP